MTTIEQIKDELRQKDDPQSKCLLMALEGLGVYAGLGGTVELVGGDARNALESICQEWHNLTTK